MSSAINVAIVGHSSSGLNQIENALQEDINIDISRKLLRDNAVDPFEDLPVTSSVVILDLAENWRDVLDSVASRVRRNRTPIILVGPDENSEMMRLALRAGARDFQPRPIYPQDLLASVHQLANEKHEIDVGSSKANVCVFMSAKGGAGSSAIVTALGHALSQRSDSSKQTLLIDLDLQYGNLPLYFDELSTTQLTQALVSNDRIDSTLFDACVIKAPSGIDILASHSDQVFSPWEIPQNTISNLFNLVCDRYDHILVDIPRQLDPITYHAIEISNSFCVTMQQTLSDLRYARQIIGLLRDQGLPNDRFHILVNRHDKKSVLRLRDISDALDGLRVSALPNDYKRMAFATDNAIALTRKYKKAPISKGIVSLAESLFPQEVETSRGFFQRKRSRSM